MDTELLVAVAAVDASSHLNQHIYLTGYRGTGKTTVGVRIASSWELPLVDLDEKIETDQQKTILEIFQEGGEPLFREFETEALKLAAAGPVGVISLGGGAILRDENRDLIKRTGFCIWLDASAEALANRIKEDKTTAQRRPSLTSQGLIDEISPMLQKRRPLYQDAADARIDTTGKTVEQVAAEAIEILRQR